MVGEHRTLGGNAVEALFSVHPTREARKAAEQRALLEGCNYIFEYQDAKGFGLNVALVDWVPDGRVWADLEHGGGEFLHRKDLAFEGRS